MAGINTKLDADQVIKQAYDEANQRLRVDASISASIGDVSIVDSDGNELEVNPDGSLNVQLAGGALQIEVSAADGDNIAISDGTNTAVVNPDGSLNTQITGTVNVNATDLDIRDLVFATDKVDVTGSNVGITGSVTVQATDLDIRNLSSITDSVDVSGSNVTVSATDLDIRNLQFSQDSVDVSGSTVTETNSSDILTELQSIDSKLPALGPQTQVNSISVTLASNQPEIQVDVELDAFTNPDPDNVQLVGSIDGTKTGQKFGIVSNLRLQILDSHDRVAEFTYADFGTKNQRITQIEYTSATFPGTTVRRVFNYTLVGNNYRRDDEVWTLV